MVSEIFNPKLWEEVPGFRFEDITYHRALDQGTVRIAFNRPEVRNAFRPKTVDELYLALDHARVTSNVGVVLLTGNGPSPKDAGWAFCSGGDQRIRGKDGYKYEDAHIDQSRLGRLHILEVQRLIRFMPKIVVAVGDDAISGGIFKGSYAVLDGVDKVIPVDFQIPGDPPSPKTILCNLLKILEGVESSNKTNR